MIFVPLASLTDPDLVPASTAAALEIVERSGEPIEERLVAYLQKKHLLLVLDNLEHLLPAADVVSRLLASCPRLSILVTSRAVLRLAVEHEYQVLPLAVPTPRHLPELGVLARYDGVQLLVQRGEAVRRGFQLTEKNAAAIAEICYRLDGLPLSIELAAARFRLFPPQALLDRLSDQLGLLSGGAHDMPARQQTLRNTIHWSYQLLSPEEKRLFARLSVFAGGWTFEAAEVVCNSEGELDLLSGMTALVEQSLVQQEGKDAPRFSMLETVREYARERFDEQGKETWIRDAHADYFLRIAEQAEPQLLGPEQRKWLARLDRELDNLRLTMQYLLEHGAAEGELRLASALHYFWFSRGHWHEAQRWLERGLAQCDGVASDVRAKALWSASGLAVFQGDGERATALLQQSLELCRRLGDQSELPRVLNALGVAGMHQGQYEQARTLLGESLELSHQVRDLNCSGRVLSNLAFLSMEQRDLTTARRRYEDALEILCEAGDVGATARTLHALGELSYYEGDLEQAEALAEESLALFRGLGMEHHAGTLAMVAWRREEHERAEILLRESLHLAHETGERRLTLSLVGAMAGVAATRNMPQRAARLKGAEAALRARLDLPMPPSDEAEAEETASRVKAALSEHEFTRAWDSGQRMSLEEVVAYALEVGG